MLPKVSKQILVTLWVCAILLVLGCVPTGSNLVSALCSETGTSIHGYTQYTPTLWVIGALLGFVLASITIARRNPDKDAPEMPVVVQNASIGAFVLILIYEMFGLFSGYTLSSITRGYAITHVWMYPLFGLLSGALISPQLDDKMSKETRFVMVLYVAILAHIFWWVTP